MILLRCKRSVVGDTLARLRVGGERQEERALVWLGRQSSQSPVEVTELYEPEQETTEDFFRIPPEGMRAMQAHLRSRRLRIVAQVHTHPREAFHSIADDRWAFVRHEGALSLVIPYFASHTTPDNFVRQVRLFRLDAENRWLEAASATSPCPLEIWQ